MKSAKGWGRLGMKCRLGDICLKITSGGTPKSTNISYYGGNIPWLRTQEVNFVDIERTEMYITQKGYDDSSAKWIPANAVIIAMYGATAGKCAISRIPLTTNQACCNLIIDNNKADYRYVYYQLKLNYEKLLGLANGGAQQNLNAKIISDYEIDLPSLNKQCTIADTLSAFDAKIADNKTVNRLLEQMAQAIFKSWFVDFEPWGGVMPEDWRTLKFSAFLTPRIEKSNDATIPLFSVTDMGIYPRREKFNKNLSKADTKNKIARENDIIFGMSREILNWGIMRSPIGGVSSAYNVFAVDNRINSKYLESFIKVHSFYFKDLIRPATREGQGVDKEALMSKSIYIPLDDVLTEYYTIEDALTAGIRENEEESARLATLRDTLLPRLMSGELSVADLAVK